MPQLTPVRSQTKSTVHLQEKLCQLLNSGDYKSLIQTCELINPKSNEQKRILLHYQGIAYTHQGHLHKAKTMLLQALRFGENIQVERDLACVYYQLQEIETWRDLYQVIQRKLYRLDSQLSFSAKHSTVIILGKFLEEEGQISEALNLYEMAQENHELIKASLAYYQLTAQLLRIKATFCPESEDLGALYTELLLCRHKELSYDLAVEVEHSLMLAELFLIGPGHAFVRLESALKNPTWLLSDKTLMAIDFIEESTVKRYELPLDIKRNLLDLRPHFNKYESEAYKLVFESSYALNKVCITKLASELPWASYLRLLILMLAQVTQSDRQTEISNKISLIMTAMPDSSRSFWQKRAGTFLLNRKFVIKVSSLSKTIMFQHRSVNLSRKKAMFTLINEFSRQTEFSVDHVIKLLWDCPYSPEHYHRLRMTIHRLNQHLFELTEKKRTIEINSEEVSLSSSVVFVIER